MYDVKREFSSRAALDEASASELGHPSILCWMRLQSLQRSWTIERWEDGKVKVMGRETLHFAAPKLEQKELVMCFLYSV